MKTPDEWRKGSYHENVDDYEFMSKDVTVPDKKNIVPGGTVM